MIEVNNVMTPSVLKHVRSVIMSNQFPWLYDGSTYKMEETVENRSNFNLVHVAKRDDMYVSEYAPLFEAVILAGIDKAEMPVNEIIRIRIASIFGQTTHVINPAHIDHPDPHQAGLIYLTTSDAPTYFYDNNGDIDFASKCKENKMILFDGMIKHSSSVPTNVGRRIVINFNYI